MDQVGWVDRLMITSGGNRNPSNPTAATKTYRHSLPELAADRRNSAPSTSPEGRCRAAEAKVVERFCEKAASSVWMTLTSPW